MISKALLFSFHKIKFISSDPYFNNRYNIGMFSSSK